MNTELDRNAGRPADTDTLHDWARRRAHELRREAIDDLWRGADAAVMGTITTARRSAQRLAYRLARHAKGRLTPVATLPTARAAAPGEGVSTWRTANPDARTP